MGARGIAKNWGEETAWLKGFHSQHIVGAQPRSSRCSEWLEGWAGVSLATGRSCASP